MTGGKYAEEEGKNTTECDGPLEKKQNPQERGNWTSRKKTPNNRQDEDGGKCRSSKRYSTAKPGKRTQKGMTPEKGEKKDDSTGAGEFGVHEKGGTRTIDERRTR